MRNESDFTSSTEEYNAIYAQTPVDPNYVADVPADKMRAGKAPMETLECQYWNRLWQIATKDVNACLAYIKDAFHELNALLSEFGVSASSAITNQLASLFKTTYVSNFLEGIFLKLSGGTIDGDLHIKGDLSVDGIGEEIISTDLKVGADTITLRNGNPAAMRNTELAGVITENYDGNGNNNILAIDSSGTARVGNIDISERLLYSNNGTNFFEDEDLTIPATIGQDEIVRDTGNTTSGGAKIYEGTTFSNDDTEAIATRADEAEMTDAKLTKWNGTKKRLETTPYSSADIADLFNAVREMQALADLDNHNGVLSATPRWLRFNPQNKKGLVIKENTNIKVGSRVYTTDSDQAFDLTDDLTANGKDYFVYLQWSESSGETVWSLAASLTKSADSDASRCIGRLHTLCAAVPASTTMKAPARRDGWTVGDDFLIKPYGDADADFKAFYTKQISALSNQRFETIITCGHPLAGFAAGDILPESVFCLTWKPECLVEDAMAYDKASDICVDIYLQSGTGQATRSAFGAATTRTRPQICHEADMLAVGKKLLSDDEFQSAALGSNEKTSIQGTAESSIMTAGGHVDTASRRMVSAIGCEDCCGGIWQWLRDVAALGTGTAYTNISGTGEYVGNAGWITEDGEDDFGQMYNCVSALLAGGGWHDGSDCGSRARSAAFARSRANAIFGGRGSSRVVRGA